MNKSGLVAEISKRTGTSKAEVADIIDSAIDVIRETVGAGDRVSLSGFGTFQRIKRNPRIGRNPREPEVPIVVPAREVPSFAPGKGFRESVATRRRRGRSTTTGRRPSRT